VHHCTACPSSPLRLVRSGREAGNPIRALLMNGAAGKIHLQHLNATTRSPYRVSRSEVTVNLMIVIGGLALLVALAVAIGTADTYARRAAWRRIASVRRVEHDRALAVRRCLASPRCPRCPIDRHLR